METTGKISTKLCTHCKEEKSLDNFYNFARTKDGKHCYCKPCDDKIRVNNRLKKKYGITLEEYQRLWEGQGEVCAICKTPKLTQRMLCVDHCHKTGEVRGILCIKCNSALGKFNDDPKLLQKAIEYLSK